MIITMRRIFTVIFTFAIMAYAPSSTSYAQCPPAYTFTGEAAGDRFGHSVSGAGDVNDDGYADLIVGAYVNDAGGSNAGRVYVYSGQTGALLYTFTGEASGDLFGTSVSGAGDVNHDGHADLIVGAHDNDVGGSNAGRAYVYSGQTGELLYIFSGEAEGDYFGVSVSGAGDVNNDGYADLIVGARYNNVGGDHAGRAYVYSGQTGGLLHIFTGEAASDIFGHSVSGAGDVNDDEHADVIVGAHYNDFGGSNAGRAYVYSGQTGALLYTFTGETEYDHFGYSVSGAGDVNHDGHADLIVGAHDNDVGGSNAGRAYVYSGQTGALLYTFTGEAEYDHFGRSVSGTGDVNNDGYADVIAGAVSAGSNAGRAYVYSGQTGALLYTFTGAAAGAKFGSSVSGAGDVNNDGYAELIVGAEWAVGGAGRAYVYLLGDIDTDGDMVIDVCDLDDDNDGVVDLDDLDQLDPTVCEDIDADGCDDCSIGIDGFGPLPDNDPANDGPDSDADGICDSGDDDDDNDGVDDLDDSNQFDPTICEDIDTDGCDDCSIGTDGFGPLPDNDPANDGPDADGDGICDTGDNCQSVYNPSQGDYDNDSIGDSCDDCTDIDNDGFGDPGYPANVCEEDNCPDVPNPDQLDNDSDGIGNPCDLCDCTSHCDLNLDGTINPLDVVFVVNWVYKQLDARQQLPTVCPRENGDWDCFDGVNPVDVVWYANFVYQGNGSGPCDPCE